MSNNETRLECVILFKRLHLENDKKKSQRWKADV